MKEVFFKKKRRCCPVGLSFRFSRDHVWVWDWLHDGTIIPCSAFNNELSWKPIKLPLCICEPRHSLSSEPKLGPSSRCLSSEERKGPGRWRQEGKYLFCGLSVALRTSVRLLRKLSPAREQPEQTIPHHAVWLATDPRVFVCSDSRHDRRRNTGKGEIWRTRERGNKNGEEEEEEEEEEVGLFHEIEGWWRSTPQMVRLSYSQKLCSLQTWVKQYLKIILSISRMHGPHRADRREREFSTTVRDATPPMERWEKFCSSVNTSGALRKDSVTAFS